MPDPLSNGSLGENIAISPLTEERINIHKSNFSRLFNNYMYNLSSIYRCKTDSNYTLLTICKFQRFIYNLKFYKMIFIVYVDL